MFSFLAPWLLCGSRDRRGSRGLRALGEGGAAAQGPPSDNGVTVYCLGGVPCPCRLQEARSSPGRTSRAVGRGLLGLGVRVVCAPCLEPPRHRGGIVAGLQPGTLGNVPLVLVPQFSGSFGTALIPLTHPFVSPHLKPLLSPRSRAGTAVQLHGSCSSVRSWEDGFPSRLWFGVGALDGIWLFITLPDLRDLRRRFCRARCRSQMAEPGSEAALGPAPQAGGSRASAQRTCRTLIAASVPTLVLVLKV